MNKYIEVHGLYINCDNKSFIYKNALNICVKDLNKDERESNEKELNECIKLVQIFSKELCKK